MAATTGSVGQVLAGRYRLVAPLGEGGMGTVWRAEHLSLGTPVAIKLVHPSVAARPGMLARFLREAQSAARLRSVHVVQILDHGESDGVPFIAMECLEGESLADRLEREGKLAPAATAEIVMSVCRALARAHRMGIVHRDLKPDNIFLAREEGTSVVKVLDFGIAKLIDLSEVDPQERTETSDNRTETGAMLGTPRYMSPEQARGRAAIDGRSDLWSLAVITFECLTGRRPFQANVMGDLLMQICSDAVPVPSSVSEVPPGFDAWFARATERDPAARFPTATAFAKALGEVLTPDQPWREPDVEAQREPLAVPTPELRDTAATSPSAVLTETAPSKPPPSRWRWGVPAALAVCAVAVGTLLTTRQPVGSPAPRASASADAASSKVEAVVGIPRPASCKPAAADATMQGLRGFRSADWQAALEGFQRALEQDPQCATPIVMLVAMVPYAGNQSSIDDLRARFRELALRRDELSPQDAAIWAGMEPFMLRDPPDAQEMARRLREASERLPDVPMIARLAALAVSDDLETAMVLIDRALQVDPGFADALQSRSRFLDALGRPDEALETLERCIIAAPTSQCNLDRIAALSTSGRCDEVTKAARAHVLSSGSQEEAYELLGRAHAAQGADGAAMEAFAQQAAQLGGERGALLLARNGAHVDVLLGRLDAAQEKARALAANVATAQGVYPHEVFVALQADLWLEAERAEELVALERDFSGRRAVWTPDARADRATPTLVDALRTLGRMSDDEARRRIASWHESERAKSTSLRNQSWPLLARFATGRDRAQELLSSAPPRTTVRMGGWIVEAMRGKLELEVGAFGDSATHLTSATRTCLGHTDPFLFVRSHLWLGQALERSDDKPGACRAYARVLALWGKSKSPPRTARDAAKRAKALGCDPG